MIKQALLTNVPPKKSATSGHLRRATPRNQRAGRLAFATAVALLLAQAAPAATDTYTGASGTDWDAAANWSPAKPGAGDTALFAPSGSLTVLNAVADQSIGSISFDTTATSTSIAIGTPTTRRLLLTDGGAIQALAGTTAGSYAVNAPLVLSNGLAGAGSYSFINNSTNGALTFGGAISGGSTGAETLVLLGTNASNTKTNTVSGVISNGTSSSLSLVVGSAYAINPWAFTAASTLTGSVTLNSGVMTLSGAGSLANANAININNTVGGAPSQLYLDNTGTTNGSRLSGTAAINLSGGGLVVSSGTTNAVAQNLGAVTLNAGGNSITVNNGGGGNTVTLASLTNSNNSLLFLAGSGAATLGAAAGTERLLVTSDSAITSSLVGGGGAAGSTTVSIVPYAVYHNNSLASDLGNGTRASRTDGGFVTYTSSGGFRALAAGEYSNANPSGTSTTNNVELTATAAISANTTVNSLWLNGSAASQTLSIAAGSTLTVTSGAFSNDNTTSGTNNPFTSVTGGTISFGGNQGYVTGFSSITSVLTGTAGVTFGGGYNATLTLGGAATYTGPTIVANGILLTGVANAIPTTTALRVDQGATFRVGNALSQRVVSLSGLGTITTGNNASTGILNVTASAITGTAGTVTVGSGGSISPGDLSGSQRAGMLTFGTSTVATNLAFGAGATLNIDLASAALNDSLALANGTFNITGGTLSVSTLNGYTPANGQTWTIITETGAGTFTSFDSTTAGYTASLSGNNLILTYAAVPEPATWAFLPVGVCLYGWWSLRRRRAVV